jgi:hypothetical protein
MLPPFLKLEQHFITPAVTAVSRGLADAILYIHTGIPMPDFDPYGTARPCLGCEHWGGFSADGAHVRCVREAVQIQADPKQGCVFWVRCIGADDEAPKNKQKRL